MKQEGYISHSSTRGLNDAIGHDDDNYKKDKTLQHTSLNKTIKTVSYKQKALHFLYVLYNWFKIQHFLK